VKIVTEYLEEAVRFERMAAETSAPRLKQQLLDQAENYWKLAVKRAAQLGEPPPVRPAPRAR